MDTIKLTPGTDEGKAPVAQALFHAGALVTYQGKPETIKAIVILADGAVKLTFCGSDKEALVSECTACLPDPEVLPALPWTARKPDPLAGYWIVESPNRREVATVYSSQGASSLTAKTICRAVNAHDALLSAVVRAQAVLSNSQAFQGPLTDSDVITELLGILDDRNLVAMVKETTVPA